MAIYRFKPIFRNALSPIKEVLVRVGVSADAVTVAGVVFAGLAGLGIWLGKDGSPWLLLVAAGAFIRTAANALDGMVAASTGTARPLGEVLNETADRVGDVAAFLPIALVPEVNHLLVSATLAAMLISSFLGVVVKAAGGPRVYSGIMGKPDRMFVLGVASMVAIVLDPGAVFSAALWIVLVGSIVTIIQRAIVARRELGAR
ncbi:MAG: CDP-alcohol phosphatidyltransferase family protein [Actinomycetota bacterium]